MDTLWTPWRMAYILGDKPEGCVLCDKPRDDRDRDNLLLHRGRHCYVIMNLFPYNPGHLLIAPYKHTASFEQLDQETIVEATTLLSASMGILRAAVSPHGFNVGMNIGKVAGAGIDEHVHMHIVPRWGGDTNFMPVISDTRVVPEALASTYDHLLPFFEKLES
ncbi:MAG: HIT domain-containing protein [Chloroflexota bacterium]|nr:MAG: HIT domain-containing protein [Chloroflexota bacterium]